jgi:membrane protein DedA with SNARE-associated domain/uncharacterized tellurite resistance protein B-like protein
MVTWLANLAGAAGVYFGARRYGRRLFATRTGRRLLAPRSLAIIEREYLRFGVAGIFVSRFLPGIRAVVPPFAGLVGLSPIRTFVPMALASATWYGGLIILATLIGSNWERINRIILGINRTLWGAALVVLVAGVIWYVVRRRRRQKERIWHATEDALDPAGPSFLAGSEIVEGSARQAAAILVLELAYADQALTPADRDLVASHLKNRWGLEPESRPPPEDEHERRTRFIEYAQRLRKRFGQNERLALVERMWTVAFSDGAIGLHEERLMHLAGELLGIPQKDLIEVRGRLQTPDRG